MSDYRIEFASSLEMTNILPITKISLNSNGSIAEEIIIKSSELYELDREEFLRYYNLKIALFTELMARAASKNTESTEIQKISHRATKIIRSIAEDKYVLEVYDDLGEPA
jgi:hypothetical protein